jgi:hypothetical protein
MVREDLVAFYLPVVKGFSGISVSAVAGRSAVENTGISGA